MDDFEPYRIETDDISLPYRLYLPDGYTETRQYPVVLTLHGAEERGCDNTSQLRNNSLYYTSDAVQALEEMFVLAPQCPAGQSWVDMEGHNEGTDTQPDITPPLNAAMEALDSVIGEYAVETSRQHVAGFSMGGYGTWDVITRYPDRFAKATPMSGGGIVTLADELGSVDVWAFHGENDTTVPASSTREMIEAMRSAGLSPKYTEFDGGHEPPPQMDTADIARWMVDD